MREFRVTVFIQICVLIAVAMIVLSVTISGIISARLNRNIELLQEHGAVMRSGTEIEPSDPFSIPSLQRNVSDIRRIIYFATATSFGVLYIGFLVLIWRGLTNMREQRQELERNVQELTALNRLFQQYLGERTEART